MASDNYLKKGLRSVEGWLNPFSAQFIAGISAVHRRLGIVGSVGEIGVHHGKLFILLHADADNSRSFAIDVFEDQHLNLDQSGKGNYAKFVRNVERWCGSSANVEIIKRSSLDVSPSEMKAAVGDVRLFSIDGGHTEECTINDIRLAESVIGKNGVVILDDVFNPQWPEVLTGLAKYMSRDDAKLRPFAITPGKVFLARVQDVDVLRREMASLFPMAWDKDGKLFGARVDIFGIYEVADPTKYKVKRILDRVGLLVAASALKEQFFY